MSPKEQNDADTKSLLKFGSTWQKTLSPAPIHRTTGSYKKTNKLYYSVRKRKENAQPIRNVGCQKDKEQRSIKAINWNKTGGNQANIYEGEGHRGGKSGLGDRGQRGALSLRQQTQNNQRRSQKCSLLLPDLCSVVRSRGFAPGCRG